MRVVSQLLWAYSSIIFWAPNGCRGSFHPLLLSPAERRAEDLIEDERRSGYETGDLFCYFVRRISRAGFRWFVLTVEDRGHRAQLTPPIGNDAIGWSGTSSRPEFATPEAARLQGLALQGSFQLYRELMTQLAAKHERTGRR